MLHLAGHHHTLNAAIFEKGDHFAKLADPDPADVRRFAIDPRIRFLVDRDDREFGPLTASAFDHEKGELSIAGDESVFHKKECRV